MQARQFALGNARGCFAFEQTQYRIGHQAFGNSTVPDGNLGQPGFLLWSQMQFHASSLLETLGGGKVRAAVSVLRRVEEAADAFGVAGDCGEAGGRGLARLSPELNRSWLKRLAGRGDCVNGDVIGSGRPLFVELLNESPQRQGCALVTLKLARRVYTGMASRSEDLPDGFTWWE